MTRTDARRKHIPRTAAATATAAALAAAILASAAPAAAQMLDEPFNFTTRDRAGLAAMIRNVENADDRRGGSGGQSRAAAPSSTVNVCFSGGSASSAAGNKECIILNEADGTIATEQSSNGDQTAENEQSVENNTELSDAIEDLAD